MCMNCSTALCVTDSLCLSQKFLSVIYSMCLSQTVSVWDRQSVSGTDTHRLSQADAVSHEQYVSVSDTLPEYFWLVTCLIERDICKICL